MQSEEEGDDFVCGPSGEDDEAEGDLPFFEERSKVRTMTIVSSKRAESSRVNISMKLGSEIEKLFSVIVEDQTNNLTYSVSEHLDRGNNAVHTVILAAILLKGSIASSVQRRS